MIVLLHLLWRADTKSRFWWGYIIVFIPGLMEQIRLGNNAGSTYRDDIMEIRVPGELTRNKRIILLIIRGIA